MTKRTIGELDRIDAEGFARDAVNALWAFMHKDDIVPAMLPQWIAGCEYMNQHGDLSNPENQAPRRIAHLWLLDAIIVSPEAVTAALEYVRDRLVDTHHELQPYAPDVVEAEAQPA